jgi:hypothetical protein
VIVLEQIATLAVSAASGIVRVGDELWVVADDELELGRYSRDGRLLGRVALFDGVLPDDLGARKRAKPDLEVLVDLGDGQLLALGSGSKAKRMRGALVTGNAVVEVDLEPLYDELAREIDRLNVEGASVLGDHLVLLTRRTGSRGRNTIVQLDLAATRRALAKRTPKLTSKLLVGILEVELGEVDGVPYGFTDATPDGARLLFTAAAEQTDDPVDDGVCVGCMIGRVDATGTVLARWPVTPLVKLEGITRSTDDTVLLVADADDRQVHAPLFRASIPIA